MEKRMMTNAEYDLVQHAGKVLLIIEELCTKYSKFEVSVPNYEPSDLQKELEQEKVYAMQVELKELQKTHADGYLAVCYEDGVEKTKYEPLPSEHGGLGVVFLDKDSLGIGEDSFNALKEGVSNNFSQSTLFTEESIKKIVERAEKLDSIYKELSKIVDKVNQTQANVLDKYKEILKSYIRKVLGAKGELRKRIEERVDYAERLYQSKYRKFYDVMSNINLKENVVISFYDDPIQDIFKETVNGIFFRDDESIAIGRLRYYFFNSGEIEKVFNEFLTEEGFELHPEIVNSQDILAFYDKGVATKLLTTQNFGSFLGFDYANVSKTMQELIETGRVVSISDNGMLEVEALVDKLEKVDFSEDNVPVKLKATDTKRLANEIYSSAKRWLDNNRDEKLKSLKEEFGRFDVEGYSKSIDWTSYRVSKLQNANNYYELYRDMNIGMVSGREKINILLEQEYKEFVPIFQKMSWYKVSNEKLLEDYYETVKKATSFEEIDLNSFEKMLIAQDNITVVRHDIFKIYQWNHMTIENLLREVQREMLKSEDEEGYNTEKIQQFSAFKDKVLSISNQMGNIYELHNAVSEIADEIVEVNKIRRN